MSAVLRGLPCPFINVDGKPQGAKAKRLGSPITTPTASDILRRLPPGERLPPSRTRRRLIWPKVRHIAPSASLTIAQAADIWIKAVALGRGDNGPAEYSTLRQYRSHLRHYILPVMGEKKLTQLSKPEIASFRDHSLTKLSRAMAGKVLRSFKGILSEAESRGLVGVNIASSVKIGSRDRHGGVY
jgi:hypothetical protein